MELDIEGRMPVVLTQASESFAFPAHAPTSARLVSGMIVDLNVMTWPWRGHIRSSGARSKASTIWMRKEASRC